MILKPRKPSYYRWKDRPEDERKEKSQEGIGIRDGVRCVVVLQIDAILGDYYDDYD